MASRPGLASKDGLSRTILDAIPSPVFVVEEDVRIVDFNTIAGKMLAQERGSVVQSRAGDALHCIHAIGNPEGCGKTPFCGNCIIRNSVNRSLAGKKVLRQKERIVLHDGGNSVEAHLLITTSPFEHRGKLLVLLILEDVTELVALRNMIPICAHCKKIRDDQKYWHNLESYFTTHLDIDFTHSLCPECAKEFFPTVFRP